MQGTLSSSLTRRTEMLAEVRQLLIDNLHLPLAPDEIDPDVALFGSGLALDSVDAMEIISSLETAFGVHFPDQAEVAPTKQDQARQAQDVMKLSLRTVNTLIDAVLWMQDNLDPEDTPQNESALAAALEGERP